MNEEEKKKSLIAEEIKKEILKKTDAVRERILLNKGAHQSDYLQILIMVSDELDDVLLNWESETISATKFNTEDDED